MDPKEIDAASQAVAIAPRVSLKDIEEAIAEVHYCTVGEALDRTDNMVLNTMTLCFLQMRNGFVFVGKAAPVSAENYNPEIGRKFAYDDCIKQIWPMMGFALRDKLLQRALNTGADQF